MNKPQYETAQSQYDTIDRDTRVIAFVAAQKIRREIRPRIGHSARELSRLYWEWLIVFRDFSMFKFYVHEVKPRLKYLYMYIYIYMIKVAGTISIFMLAILL